MITDDTVLAFSVRRAYVGFCPEKQALLLEMRQILFKNKDQDRLQAISDRLEQITFTPSYPKKDRNL